MNLDQNTDPDRRSHRIRARQRAELVALCRTGDLAHAVDLAFEHLAVHGADEALLCELCAAASRTDITVVTRHRLDALIRSHRPGTEDQPEPCRQLLAHLAGPAVSPLSEPAQPARRSLASPTETEEIR